MGRFRGSKLFKGICRLECQLYPSKCFHPVPDEGTDLAREWKFSQFFNSVTLIIQCWKGSSVFSSLWIEVLIQNLQQRISCVQNKALTGDKLPPNFPTHFCILMQIVPRKSKIFIITALSKSPNISGSAFTKSLHRYKIVAYHQLWVLLFSYLLFYIYVHIPDYMCTTMWRSLSGQRECWILRNSSYRDCKPPDVDAGS